MVSEQPVSANEDSRVLRRLTGLALLEDGLADEEKAEELRRRDTGVAGLGYNRGSNGSDKRTDTSTEPGMSTRTSASNGQ